MQSSEIKTSDASTFLESGSKGLRTILNKHFLGAEHAFETDSYQKSRGLPKANEKYGLGTSWDSYWGPGKQNLPVIHDLNTNIITRNLTTLDRTRQLAAQDVGIDGRIYSDFAKDLPIASSFEQLQTQYTAIRNYTDRTSLQKQYLQEKAGVRYLMGFSNKMGYGADLYDVVHEKSDDTQKDAFYQGTKYGLLPSAYRGMDFQRGASTNLKEVPAWVNKGETPLDASLFDLAGWQTEAEKKYTRNYDEFVTDTYGDLGYDPEDIIRLKGIETRSRYLATQLAKTKEEEQTVKPKTEQTKTEQTEETKTGWRKGEKRPMKKRDPKVKGLKDDWVWQQISDFNHMSMEDDLHDQLPYWLKRNPHEEIIGAILHDGRPMSYTKYLQLVQSGEFRPSDIGAHNLADMAEALLKGEQPWIPKNLKLNEQNLPANLVRGNEHQFHALLNQLDDNPALKNNADHLHELVEEPKRQAYMAKYHPNTTGGPENLTDDWSLPFIHKQNSVEFNHQIHHQMDFGIDEI
jgi:hypothetical protein